MLTTNLALALTLVATLQLTVLQVREWVRLVWLMVTRSVWILKWCMMTMLLARQLAATAMLTTAMLTTAMMTALVMTALVTVLMTVLATVTMMLAATYLPPRPFLPHPHHTQPPARPALHQR
jgi:hypothetical protein